MLNTADSARHEAEQKLLEAIKLECSKLLGSMRAVSPPEAERIRLRLDEVLKRAEKLPLTYKRKVAADARAFECIANTRAADAILNAAVSKAKENDMVERNRLVGEARGLAHKAMMLGAAASFQSAFDRKIEIIMLTGGVGVGGRSYGKPSAARR